MEIREITGDRKRFLPLLLLADEQESMVGRYLERGVMYVLDDNGVKAECVVTDEGDGVLEIKNIRQPRQVKELIHQQVEKMKLARRMRVGEVLEGSEASDLDFMEEV